MSDTTQHVTMDIPVFPENIRLIIWDLDETFWQGTLEEGPVQIPSAHVSIVTLLAKRGIISSICSKNSPEPTRQRLEADGLLQWFVFPMIGYEFKSLMIANIIEQMGLRAETILFIDDNHFNRGEVSERIPGINVCSEAIIPQLLAHPQLQGKPDLELARLERYRVLEMKQTEIKKAEQPKDFLRDCQIEVSFHFDIANQFDRIHDMVNRTNQLNFTKQRWNEDLETARAEYDKAAKRLYNTHSGYIKVRDKFGYYGICGFFEVVTPPGRATHFLFSCRVLNMGVEQFVYQVLKFPAIKVQGPCAAELKRTETVDWIKVVPDAEAADASAGVPSLSLCLHGPCELAQSAHYLRPFYTIIEEFQFPKAAWGVMRPLVRNIRLADEFKTRGISGPEDLGLSKDFGGLDFPTLETALFAESTDVNLFSFSFEAEIALYKHRATGLVMPLVPGKIKPSEAFTLTAQEIADTNPNFILRHIEEFQKNFEFRSLFEIKLLEADLSYLRGKLERGGKPFIVVEGFDDIARINLAKYRTNKLINETVRKHLASLPGAHFIKLSDFVEGVHQQIQLNHFQREVYASVATAIKNLISALHLPSTQSIATTVKAAAPPVETIAPALAQNEQARPGYNGEVVTFKAGDRTAPAIQKPSQNLPAPPVQVVTPQSKPKPKIVFLHIPKTAGQSVHHFLSFFFKPNEISPARINEQLLMMPVQEIRKYRLFSGHMDWSLLDCVDGPRFTFTILREPVSRIVSFYLYLLREAKLLSAEELQLPQNGGKRAILELSCDQYFTAGPMGIRTFLDNHYDNFYAYFFAGRRYDARQKLKGIQAQDKSFTNEKIVEMAIANLKLLDGVYTVDTLGRLEKDIRAATGMTEGGPALETLRVNTGDANDIDQRLSELGKLGATEATFKRIKAMTALDQQIWEKFCEAPELPALKSVS